MTQGDLTFAIVSTGLAPVVDADLSRHEERSDAQQANVPH
jgi:hypothetical protein